MNPEELATMQKCCILIVQLCVGISGKNTKFPGLSIDLHQEEHPTVKYLASIKSCKCQISHGIIGLHPLEMVSFLVGKH